MFAFSNPLLQGKRFLQVEGYMLSHGLMTVHLE